MTAWPATLPQIPLLSGFEQDERDTAVRTAMEYGPDKVRPKVTAALFDSSCKIVLGFSDIDTLDTFYAETIDMSGTFTWTDQLTQSTASCKFLAPPRYEPAGAGVWIATLNLEIIR